MALTQPSFERLAAVAYGSYDVSGNGEPERAVGATASADLFSVLGIQPLQGRAFAREEEQFGKHHVVVVSKGLSDRRFGAQTSLSGQSLKLNGETFSIVGVMPAAFQFPDPGVRLWVPLAIADDSEFNTRGNHWLSVIGRLKSEVTRAQAQADIAAIQHQLEQQAKGITGLRVTVTSLRDATVGNVQRALLVLLAAVIFVLLICCANVANLLLARAAARQREIAVRMALGASRWRLVRQLLTESLLIGLAGGAAALFLAWKGVDLLVSLEPNLPRLGEIKVDISVLLFTLGLTLVTSLVFGLAPAIQSTRA